MLLMLLDVAAMHSAMIDAVSFGLKVRRRLVLSTVQALLFDAQSFYLTDKGFLKCLLFNKN